MSMQVQAKRERQASVILGDSERQIAEKFAEAANSYANNPTSFHLRAIAELHHRRCAQHGGRQHAAWRHCWPDGIATAIRLERVI